MKRSIYKRTIVAIVTAMLIVIMLLGVSNFFLIQRYLARARQVYQNSLQYYCTFWEDKFRGINTSLLTLIGKNYGQPFQTLCDSSDTLSVEIAKIETQQNLTEIAYMYDDQIGLFVYVPERRIYIASGNRLGGYEDSRRNEKALQAYIDENSLPNDNAWDVIDFNGTPFFVQVYHMGSGYAGAMIQCETVLANLTGSEEGEAEAAILLDGDQNVAVRYGGDVLVERAELFSHQLNGTAYRLGIAAPRTSVNGMVVMMGVFSISIIALGVAATLVILRYQWRVVIEPLNQLRDAMEAFGKGRTDVKLEGYPRDNEIQVLHHTFNDMIDEILRLKIEVYENALEKQDVTNKYLRIQIQPHFYTNILNLIYSLAQVKDYDSIQRLTTFVSRYFRYSLSDKEDFVPLKAELDCLEDYVNVQMMRYPDFLEWHLENHVDENAVKIPPLMLQTFVENSIKHNITLVPVLRIALTIDREGGNVRFSIRDNGLGFSQELLERLNRGENIEEAGRHIGIVNVKKRLELLYDGGARVEIRNCDEGSEVVITLKDAEVSA